MNTNK